MMRQLRGTVNMNRYARHDSSQRRNEPVTLAYWFDIAIDARDDWLAWYVHDHTPARLVVPFVSARCYEAVRASRRHMALFEAPTEHAMYAPAYFAELSQITPEAIHRRKWYSNTIRATCHKWVQAGSAGGSVVGVLRIDDEQTAKSEFGQGPAEHVLTTLAQQHGIGSVQLLKHDAAIRRRIDEARLTGTNDATTELAVIVEGSHQTDIEAALSVVQRDRSWRAMMPRQSVELDTYRLLYALHR